MSHRVWETEKSGEEGFVVETVAECICHSHAREGTGKVVDFVEDSEMRTLLPTDHNLPHREIVFASWGKIK